MSLNRRDFLKIAGAAGACLAGSKAGRANAAAAVDPGREFNGMLIDTTKCIGCRACEEACNQKNKLAEPEVSFSSAFTRHADAQAGWLQWRHCFRTKIGASGAFSFGYLLRTV